MINIYLVMAILLGLLFVGFIMGYIVGREKEQALWVADLQARNEAAQASHTNPYQK